jgi:hypothetical protein
LNKQALLTFQKAKYLRNFVGVRTTGRRRYARGLPIPVIQGKSTPGICRKRTTKPKVPACA